MIEEKSYNADLMDGAQAAWDGWHEGMVENQPNADKYIPDMLPIWAIAFASGAAWAVSREAGEGEE